MRVVAVILALLLSGTAAVADEQADKQYACIGVANLAKTVMSSRQAGVPVTDMLALLQSRNELVQKIAAVIITTAYGDVQLMSTAEGKAAAVTEFQTLWYIGCMRW